MEEKEILQLIEKLKECIGEAHLLSINPEDIFRFSHDPEFILSQTNENARAIALEMFAIYAVFKNRGIVHFSTSGRPFYMTETDTHRILHTPCSGADLRYLVDKETGEIEVDDTDVLKSYGIDDVESFLKSDEGLDIVNKIKNNHPEIPIFGKDGIFGNLTNRTKKQ